MGMRKDFQIALLCAAASIPFGVALMAAPEYITYLKEYAGLFFWGGLILTAALLGAALVIAIRGEVQAEKGGQESRMFSLVGMIISAVMVVGFTAWHFWPSGDDRSSLANLAALGWTIQPQPDGTTQFEISGGRLPSGEKSAPYFRALRSDFRLHFQGVTSIEGLHFLGDIERCKKIEINAGEFTDISELSAFKSLEKLTISQLPLNGTGFVDLSPLSSLTNLRELNLGTRSTSIDALKPLVKLKIIGLGVSYINDLSALSDTTELESFGISEQSKATDLSPLSNNKNISIIRMSSKQIYSLRALPLDKLKELVITDNGFIDLRSMPDIPNLESLMLMGETFNLDGLHRLNKLKNLDVNGLAFGSYVPIMGIDEISQLPELRSLSLSSIKIDNINFIRGNQKLVGLTLSMVPVTSLDPLTGNPSIRGLSLYSVPAAELSPLLTMSALSELTVRDVPGRYDIISTLSQRGVHVSAP